MATITPIRIPVCDADGVIVERVDAARARRLALAPNATVVRKKRGPIVRILLASTAPDDYLENAMRGNPLTYSHKHEKASDPEITTWAKSVDENANPEKVWCLKRIPTSTADIFRAVITDLAA